MANSRVHFEVGPEELELIRRIQKSMEKDIGRVTQVQAIRRALRIADAQLAERETAA